METMKMTTITISEKIRRELLRLAAELQSERGEKMGYEDAIECLIKSRKNPELLRRAKIGGGVPSEEFRKSCAKGEPKTRGIRKRLSAVTPLRGIWPLAPAF